MNTTKIVVSVERTPCSSLNGIMKTSLSSVKIPDAVQWEKIAVRPHASLAVAEKIDDKVHLYTATLKFFTCQDFNERDRYAYRLKLTNGKFILLGTNRRPYPIMTVQENLPDKPSDNQWKEITVAYTSDALLPQIDG